MRPQPHTIEATESLGTAHRSMREHAIRHLPVMRGSRLVGVLSDRDLLGFRAHLGFTEDWARFPASAAMTPSPQTAGPDDSLTEVAARFAYTRLGSLPVVDRGALVGIITVSDVLSGEVQAAMAPVTPPKPTAAVAMTQGPFTCGPDDNLLVAARRMSTHGIRHLPVVDDRHVVIGMLSERDLRTFVGDPSKFAATHGETAMRVKDALTLPVVTVGPDRPLAEVARLFEDARVGAIPVVDGERRLIGIVSYVDVLRVFAQA